LEQFGHAFSIIENLWISKNIIFKMISLSMDFKIMISSHIIFRQNNFFENMISRANMKSMPGYGHERYLGLGCRLLGDQNKIVGVKRRSLQCKKVVGAGVGH